MVCLQFPRIQLSAQRTVQRAFEDEGEMGPDFRAASDQLYQLVVR